MVVIGSIPDEMPLDARTLYLVAVHHMRRYTKEERLALAVRIERGKAEQQAWRPDPQVVEDAQQACDELVESFQRLVVFLADRWVRRFRHLEWLDLVQEGNQALLQMITFYELMSVHNLGSLAGACIGHAFCRLLRDRETLIRFPGQVVELGQKVGRVSSQVRQTLGREPSLEELAQVIQVPVTALAEAVQVQQLAQVESLHALLMGEEEAQETQWRITSLYGSDTPDEARQAQAAVLVERGCAQVLTDRQREIVTRYHGLGEYEPQTFKQIGEALECSKDAVWCQYRRAMGKLKRYLGREYGQLCGQQMEGYYTASQAAAVVGLSVTSFLGHVKRGKLTRYPFGTGRCGRYSQREVEAWAAARRAAGGSEVA